MQKFTLPLLVSSLYLSPVCSQEQQDLGAPVFGPKPEAAGPQLSGVWQNGDWTERPRALLIPKYTRRIQVFGRSGT